MGTTTEETLLSWSAMQVRVLLEYGIAAIAFTVFVSAAAFFLLLSVSISTMVAIYTFKVCSNYFIRTHHPHPATENASVSTSTSTSTSAVSENKNPRKNTISNNNMMEVTTTCMVEEDNQQQNKAMVTAPAPVSSVDVSSVSGDLFSHHHLPQDLVLHICNFLHPRSVTSIACLNKASKYLVDGESPSASTSASFINDDDEHAHSHEHETASSISGALWRSLWMRDYGSVLLDWEISLCAFQNSLLLLPPNSKIQSWNKNASASSSAADMDIAKQIQLHIETMLPHPKTFYFQFQYTFIDYILAGHNTPQKCLMGIHGHILDFTAFAPSHPGLLEPIVVEGGRDATDYFEDTTIRHSKSARTIARKLCMVVDRSCWRNSEGMGHDGEGHGHETGNDDGGGGENDGRKKGRRRRQRCDTMERSCGLYRIPSTIAQTERTAAMVRQSNTRPTSHNDHDMKLGLDKLFPHRPFAKTRRPATLHSIQDWHRRGMDQAGEWGKRFMAGMKNGNGNGNGNGNCRCSMRVYYDPFVAEWRGWYSDEHWTAIFCDMDE